MSRTLKQPSRHHIQRIGWLRAAVLGANDGILSTSSLIVGVAGSYIFGEVGDMRTELVPMSLPLAFLASATVGIFFGYYPARKAAELDPIEALRRE